MRNPFHVTTEELVKETQSTFWKDVFLAAVDFAQIACLFILLWVMWTVIGPAELSMESWSWWSNPA